MPALTSIIAGGAALIGGASQVISGNKAAKAQKKAAQISAENERYFYDTTRADQAPYREVGQGALYKLADMYGVSRPLSTPQAAASPPAVPTGGGFGGIVGGFRGLSQRAGVQAAPANETATPVAMTPGYDGFQASPGYEFRLSEGIKAAERSAAARGLLGSGGTLKAIQRYGEGLASSEYENYSNRLAALAGIGQTATNATSAAGQSAAQGISNATINAGNARASAYANTGSAINSGINNALSGYLYTQGGGFGGGTFNDYGRYGLGNPGVGVYR
jgi:hypothetical protein